MGLMDKERSEKGSMFLAPCLMRAPCMHCAGHVQVLSVPRAGPVHVLCQKIAKPRANIGVDDKDKDKDDDDSDEDDGRGSDGGGRAPAVPCR